VTKDHASLTVARDPERRVTWLIRLLPWRLDLRRGFDDVLRADLEADARHLFDDPLDLAYTSKSVFSRSITACTPSG
jgi:hypothetical protein